MNKVRIWLIAAVLVCPYFAYAQELYQLDIDGQYTGSPCSGNPCSGSQGQQNDPQVIPVTRNAVMEVCVPPDQQQHLAVTLRPQETYMWCWAASAQMGMEFLGHNVNQCVQANNRFGRRDCCNNPTPNACIQGGWPEFLKYNFVSQHTANTALSWDQLRSELADISPCGRRPVAFSWH